MKPNKQFYLIDEVATELGIDERQVIEYALDGSLTLSIEPTSLIHYEQGNIVDDECLSNFGMQFAFIENKYIEFEETLRVLHGELPRLVLDDYSNAKGALKLLKARLPANKFANAEINLTLAIFQKQDGSYIRPLELGEDGEWHPFFNIPNNGILGVIKKNLETLKAKVPSAKVVHENASIGNEVGKKYISKGISRYKDAITPVIIDAYNECHTSRDAVCNAEVLSMLAAWANSKEGKARYPTLLEEVDGEIKWQGSSKAELLNLKMLGDRLRKLKKQ
ncbi:hypothetical protein ICN32_00830 [Polynucleobacter wuianus]|uniref:hypothetical protein n=1 Tax=Polynucleobacter wuianus TaxID=1743168 RepID=UPI001C0DB7F5|nr:hypothetical protein [Polynucleobacter wuianus]MBU3609102.1 hypothetical protein [Polynucleobacter wuianus]